MHLVSGKKIEGEGKTKDWKKKREEKKIALLTEEIDLSISQAERILNNQR